MKNKLKSSTIFIDAICIINILPLIVIGDIDSIIRFALTLYCASISTYSNLVGFKNEKVKDFLYYTLIVLLVLFIIYVITRMIK